MYRGKRLFDVVLTAVAAPLWVPAVLIIALIVGARIGTPIFFRQKRIGMNDRPFTLVKFRTMTNAIDASGRLLPDADRLPPFGQLLRSTSLDELPELWNVLLGDMSLVGPRPLLPQYLPRYSAAHRGRHSVRPGLTGLAQVQGRNALSWAERFDLDLAYIRRATVGEDIRLLWQTVGAVFSGHGVTAREMPTMPEFTHYADDVDRPDGPRRGPRAGSGE